MKTVILSAGHHPAARGACHGAFCEHEEAVRWVRLVRDYIGNLEEDIDIIIAPFKGLGRKVQFINHYSADLAVEIHFNACGGCGASGSETLYMPGSEKGRRAARAIQGSIASVFKPSRGAKEGWFKMDRPGIKDYADDVEGDEQPDYFLRKTNCPAVIVEPEFIHNVDVIKNGRINGSEALALGIMVALGAIDD